jgi:hypothetical protein
MNIANRRNTAERHWRAAKSALSDEALAPVQPGLISRAPVTINAPLAWSGFERTGGCWHRNQVHADCVNLSALEEI